MVFEMKFNSIAEIEALQRLAAAADRPVLLSSGDGSIQVDARSFIGMFTLDFSKPVKVNTESVYVMRRLEAGLRQREEAMAHAR